MENWEYCWTKGFVPHISTEGLQRLLKALENDDARLVQGAVTMPTIGRHKLVEGACAVGFCFWKGDELDYVGEIDEAFSEACLRANQILGGGDSIRFFLNWFDEMPREKMRRLFIPVVRQNLEKRENV